MSERTTNAEQAEAWNGEEGEHWAANADRYDSMTAGFADDLLAAAQIGSGERVLDIGCGNGQTTRRAARQAVDGAAWLATARCP